MTSKKEISKDDWGRKEWVNVLILGLGMTSIIVGLQQYIIFRGFEGLFVTIFGVFILMYQHHFLWRLIEENKK